MNKYFSSYIQCLNLEFDLQELIEKAEKQPNVTIGVLVSIIIVILTLLLKIIFGGKKKPVRTLSTP